jgi:hypothetical protein
VSSSHGKLSLSGGLVSSATKTEYKDDKSESLKSDIKEQQNKQDES